MKRELLLAICTAVLVAIAGREANAKEPTATQEHTLWEHNGSIVYLVANGTSREFYYKHPRPGMLEAGALPGSLLFRGQSTEGYYSGTAFIFNRRCGQLPYRVSGPILDNHQRVVLTGQAPRVGPDCRIRGHFTDTLDFRLLQPSEGLSALTGASDSAAPSDRAPPTTTATTAYDSSWYISKSWGGEYPNGFAVVENHTVVTARATMDKKAPRSIECELPYLAVIHPWNHKRIKKNRIEFISATKTAPLIAKRDFIFRGYTGDREVKFRVKKGTTLTYLQYLGEGNFEIKLDGRKYTADQDLFEHVDDSDLDGSAVDEWVLMTCENGVRAYIYMPDLFSVSDDGTQTHFAGVSDVGPGMIEYGKARDLTPAEARDQRAVK